MAENFIALRRIIDHYDPSSPPEFTSQDIQGLWQKVEEEALALQTNEDPHAQAASFATQLALHLLWPSSPETDLTPIARELKEATCRFPARFCPFMELTSCQLVLGAIASGAGSDVRSWFVERLRRTVHDVRSRGWKRPLGFVGRRCVVDVGLAARIKEVWAELDDSSFVEVLQ